MMRGILVRAVGVCLLLSAGNTARASTITFTQINPQATPLLVPPYRMEGQIVATVTRAVVSALGEKARGRVFKLSVIDLPVVNAFAGANGSMVVFTGLLHEISYDTDALAFIIAHELTHILNNHGAKSVDKQGKIALWSTIFASMLHWNSDSFKAAMAVGEFVSGLPFARKLEHEADLGGVDAIFKMGISPESAIRFLESGMGNQSTLKQNMKAMLCDHPATHDRISRIRARYDALRAEQR